MTFSSVNVVPILSHLSRAMVGDSSAEPSPKRARIEVPAFQDLDLKQLALVDKGASKQGSKLTLPLLGSERLRCNLTPVGFLATPFGFDVSGKYQKPSFLVGGEAGKSEGLGLVLQLGDAEASFLRAVDEFYKAEFVKLDKKSQWHDLVAAHEKHGVQSKVKVVLQGAGLTQLKIVGLDKQIHTGYGWDFLKLHLSENHNFRRSRCKVTISLSSLWNVSRKAGLTLAATHLVLVASKSADAVEEDVFDDDELLRELTE